MKLLDDSDWTRAVKPLQDQTGTLAAAHRAWTNAQTHVNQQAMDCPLVFNGQAAVRPLAGEYPIIDGVKGLCSAPFASVEIRHATYLVIGGSSATEHR